MSQTMPHDEVMYKALLDRDPEYEGVFVVGVKTTGIFCRPTCHARKPKKENVEFFQNAKEALERGFHPCKKCRPLSRRGEVPPWLIPLMKEVEADPDVRIGDADLVQRGLAPNRVRRWFRENFGNTFQGYLRTRRVSRAFGRIRHGEKVSEVAFDSGYDSLSGFSDTFKKTVGFSPSQCPTKGIIFITRMLTPMGPMLAGATPKGICLLEFMDRRMIELQLTRLRKQFTAELVPGESPFFETLHAELREYFAGKRSRFSVPLDIAGTEFQKRAWQALQEIPHGATRSYRDQTQMLKLAPGAVRAVARANGDNKIAIIIPCHRVIGSDGKLVGYGGGLWRKKLLLDLEHSGKPLEVAKKI